MESPTLELPLLLLELLVLLSEDAVGALDRMLVNKLEASVVSPDFKSLSSEASASFSGLVWLDWLVLFKLDVVV